MSNESVCYIVIFLSALITVRGLAQQSQTETHVSEFTLSIQEQARLVVSEALKASLLDMANVFRQLTSSETHDLGPLSGAERLQLRSEEPGVPLEEKIGIVRTLRQAIRLSSLDPSMFLSSQGVFFQGGRVDLMSNGRLAWTTAIASPGATAIRVEVRDVQLITRYQDLRHRRRKSSLRLQC